MQPWTSPILHLLAVAAASEGASLHRAADRHGALGWGLSQEAEAKDTERFFASEWAAVETELRQLRRVAAAVVNSTKQEKKIVGPPVQGEAAKDAAPAKGLDLGGLDLSKLAGLAGLGKKAKAAENPAMLVPMLGMLKGLYESGRGRIAGLNKREKLSKEHFENFQKEHETNIDRIETAFKAGKMSKEMHFNATRDENRQFSYWPGVREREHRQYHNMLKIQHGTMEKEKMMIDMYEKTIAGKGSQDVEKKLGRLAGQMPEVTLLQAAQSVSRFCSEALEEARVAAS